jgi:hypothetical protein
MRRYLLDTALVAAYPLNRPGAVALLSPWITRREAATSIVVYGEVVEDIRGRPDYPTLREQLQSFSGRLPRTSSPTRSWSATPTPGVRFARRAVSSAMLIP